MPLIACPECRQRISEFANSCPRCGYVLAPGEVDEIKEKEAESMVQAMKLFGYGCGCLVILFLFVVLLVMCSS